MQQQTANRKTLRYDQHHMQLPRDSHYGNVNPDRAFTAEMSDELIPPDAFTSNRKFSAVVDCPDRAFMPLMSLEFTDRLLFASPTRKPIEVGGGLIAPFTLLSVTVTRWLSGMPVSVTRTSLSRKVAVALPTGETLTVPAELI